MSNNTEHANRRRQGDEYVCFVCSKRWHYSEEEPPCDVTFFCAHSIPPQVLADEQVMLGMIPGYWLCVDQHGIETVCYSNIDKIKFMNRYQGAVCTWIGETKH